MEKELIFLIHFVSMFTSIKKPISYHPQISDIHNVSYMAFIVPGLVMMSVINNSFINVAGSFFSSKFQRSIEELLVSPVPDWVIIAGYGSGGMIRGIISGTLVFCVSVFFTKPTIFQIGYIFIFIIMTAAVFALGGLMNGLLAKKFDDISIFPTFFFNSFNLFRRCFLFYRKFITPLA